MTKQALDRAVKLRALMQSSSPGEAANALAALQRLMLRHGLTADDVDAAAKGQSGAVASLDDPLYVRDGSLPAWQMELLLVLAEAFGCAEFHGYDAQGTKQIGFVAGRPEDVSRVRHLWLQTVAVLSRLSREAFDARRKLGQRVTRAYRDGWLLGAVLGIEQALKRGRKAAKADGTAGALAIVDKRAVDAAAAIQAAFAATTREPSAPIVDGRALKVGKKVGRSLDLASPQLAGRQRRS